MTPRSVLVVDDARGAMAHVGLKCGRSGGSGTFTTEWRNVQTRVLGISR